MESIKNFLSIKKIYIIPLIAICIFFSGFKNVYAADTVEWDKVTFECIYSDGSVMTYAESNNSENAVNRTTMNLNTASTVTANTSSGIAFVASQDGKIPIKDDHHCKSHMATGQVKDKKTSTDDYEVYTTYYKFQDGSGITFTDEDIASPHGWWSWLFGNPDKDNANNTKQEFELVSESIKMEDNARRPGSESIYYYKQQTEEEASGEEFEQYSKKDKYIAVYHYGDVWILQSGNRMTLLDSFSPNEVIYVNDPSPVSQSNSSGAASYKFYDKSFIVCSSKNCGNNSATVTRFVIAQEECNDMDGDGVADCMDMNNNDLCEEIMPETSKVLRKIIKYVQYLIPALLIVLCGLDFGKAVYTGKIEDEFPKVWKRTIIRFVVAVSIFFLPIIVDLIIDMLHTSGGEGTDLIQQIGCLFE